MLKKYGNLIDKMDLVTRKIALPSGIIGFAHMPIILHMKNKGVSDIIVNNGLKSLYVFFGIMMFMLLTMLIVSIPYGIIMGCIESRDIIKRKFTEKGKLLVSIEEKKFELHKLNCTINRIKDEYKKLEDLNTRKEICEKDIIRLEEEYNREVV